MWLLNDPWGGFTLGVICTAVVFGGLAVYATRNVCS